VEAIIINCLVDEETTVHYKQEEGNGMNLKRTASMKVKPGTRLSMDVLSVAEP